jgi:hypothetical protein
VTALVLYGAAALARGQAVFATAERRKPRAFRVAVTARVERSRRDAHRLLGVHTPIDTAVNHAVAARRRRTHASERTVARRPVQDGDVHGLAEMPCERSCRGDDRGAAAVDLHIVRASPPACYAAGGCGRRQPSVTRDMSRSAV